MPSPPAQNDYEAEREARIMANRARLAHLGLASGPAAASSSSLPRRKKERSATAWSRREREPGAARRRMVATVSVAGKLNARACGAGAACGGLASALDRAQKEEGGTMHRAVATGA
jgi:hypothetical protein